MRLVAASLRRLRRRPASLVTLLLLIGLQALITLLIIVATRATDDPQAALGSRMFLTFPNAYELIVQMLVSTASFLAVCYGAAIAGSEWGWGTLKAAVARGESRVRYTLANYAGVAVFTVLGLVLAFLASVAVTALGAAATNVSLSGMTDAEALLRLPELFARAWLGLALNAAVGFVIATVARSQLAGIGASIGLLFASGIAGVFAPHLVKWLPFSVSGAVLNGGDGGGVMVGATEMGVQLDSTTAIWVSLAWLVVALGVAALYVDRSEING